MFFTDIFKKLRCPKFALSQDVCHQTLKKNAFSKASTIALSQDVRIEFFQKLRCQNTENCVLRSLKCSSSISYKNCVVKKYKSGSVIK